MSNLVGLCGRAGSGKSVVAHAMQEIDFERIRFSTPLKNMLRAFFQSCGLDHREIERRIEGDLKEVPDELLGGKTPRYAMQTLGKEWGRDLISPTIWTEAWRSGAVEALSRGVKIVAEDVRFETEDAIIHELGGIVVEVVGRQKDEVEATHASENFEGVKPDFAIHNNSTIIDLRKVAKYVFREPREYEVAE